MARFQVGGKEIARLGIASSRPHLPSRADRHARKRQRRSMKTLFLHRLLPSIEISTPACSGSQHPAQLDLSGNRIEPSLSDRKGRRSPRDSVVERVFQIISPEKHIQGVGVTVDLEE